MWELFTCGQIPYRNIEFEDIQIAITNGKRPFQPKNCPNDMYVLKKNLSFDLG